MNRLLAILILSAVSWAQAPAPKPATNLNDSDNARKARTLLDQTVQALGGQAYLTYTNKSEEGRFYSLYHGQSGTLGIPYYYYIEYPDKDRFEVVHRGTVVVPLPTGDIIPVGHDVKHKADIVLIHNGEKGYETTYKGTAPQEPKDLANYLRRRMHSLDWVFRKWINDPNVAMFYDGFAVVDSKPADEVTLLNSQNDSVTVFLDQNSHLPVKTTYSWRDPEDKQKDTEEEIYDNYKPVQGIMSPHSITRTFNGEMSQQRFITVAKYNLPLPPGTFEASVTYDPMAPPPLKKK